MLGVKEPTGVMANDGKPFKQGEPMQSTGRPAAAGKSHLKPDFNLRTRTVHYRPAIALVVAALMGAGTGLLAQSATPPEAGAGPTDPAAAPHGDAQSL